MKAFVAGATGATGRRIVAQLVERHIPVKALVRDRTRGVELLPDGVELVVGDVLNPDSFKAALSDCTVVLCATGASPSLNPLGPFQVDYVGTKNLVDLAKQQEIQQFVLVSSLCTSKLLHPLNLFWLILFWKKQAEEYLMNSSLNYTVVRPGGLRETESEDAVVMSTADTLFDGGIARSKVAQVCIEALFSEAAQKKIVEIVARADAPAQPIADLFASVTS